MALAGYRAYRLEACRPFIHVPSDPNDDLAGYALSKGFDLRLLESYKDGSWLQDSLYRILKIALRHYQEYGEAILVDDLVRIVSQRKPEQTSVVDEASVVGELAGYPLGDRGEILSAITRLIHIRAYWEYRQASEMLEEKFRSGEIPPSQALREMISNLRSTLIWSDRSGRKADLEVTHSLRQELPSLIGTPDLPGSKPPLMIGFPKIDAASYGLRRGDLCIIGGLTGVGKTWLLNYIAAHAATTQERRVVIASAEMEWERNFLRLGGILTGRNYRDFDAWGMSEFARELNVAQVKRAISEKLSEGDIIVIGPQHCSTTTAIRECLWDLSRTGPVDLLMVDYLQEIKPANEYRSSLDWEVVGETAGDLKDIAEEFEIPVICMAQTSIDRVKEAPSIRNIAYSRRPAQIVTMYLELRHSDPKMDIMSVQGSDGLPVVRDMTLHVGKLREGASGMKECFQMDFRSGVIKPYAVEAPMVLSMEELDRLEAAGG